MAWHAIRATLVTHRIRKAGLTRPSGAGSGAITFFQRFGSAVNVNVHLHMLNLHGVYSLSGSKPRYALKRPDARGVTHFGFDPLDLLAKLAGSQCPDPGSI